MTAMRRLAMRFEEMLGGETTYWLRKGEKVALHVCLMSGMGCRNAAKAMEKAGRLAREVGFDGAQPGAFVHGREVIGVAEVPWTPGIEQKLSKLGLVEVA